VKLNLLIRNLRRRKVFRGAGFYLLGAWVVLQVADVIAEPAGLPLWSLTALLYLCILFFPVAIFLSWRYEWSDDGLVRTMPVDLEDTDAPGLTWLDYAIFFALILAIGSAAWQLLPVLRQQAAEQHVQLERTAEDYANSIAVLPFEFLSADLSQSYLADGISDTVMHMLSKVEGLSVTARTSAFYYKDKHVPLDEIGRELQVAHLLEGSIQMVGTRVRVIARLIETVSGTETWSQNFDREMDDIFEVQDEIAMAVMTAMHEEIIEDSPERLPEEYRPALPAYEQVIIGRIELFKNTVKSMKKAEGHFKRAIELDPGYAWAYVNLVSAWQDLGPATGVNHADNLVRIRQMVEKAIELDPTSGEAWDEMAVLAAIDKDWKAAEEYNLRAIELAPSYAQARLGRGNLLLMQGNTEAYLQHARIAAKLDPASSKVQLSLAAALWENARSEEAISVLKKNLRTHPSIPENYSRMSRYLMQLGQAGEAMRYAYAQFQLDPENLALKFGWCNILDQAWDFEGARSCLESYLRDDPDHLDALKSMAFFRGDLQEVLRLCEEHMLQDPNSWYRKLQWAWYASMDQRWAGVIETLAPVFPQLMADEPQVDQFSIWPARILGQAFLKSGQPDQANRILDAAMEAVERMRLVQGGGFTAGIDDAMIHAIRGNRDLALERLEAGIDKGWRLFTQWMFVDPNFMALRDDPGFIALKERMAGIMEQERAYFEAHKREPLF
jgi:TolB-like protein/cytochrome c-type biogenesis protein CcmH/NrfG